MAKGELLESWVGRFVVVHTDREGIPGIGILRGYDDLGVMLHIPIEVAEEFDRAGAPADASLIFVPWRIVRYVATDLRKPGEARKDPA